MSHHVVWQVGTKVFEELAAAIFKGQVPLKYKFVSTELHSIVSQVRYILIFIVMRTLNLTE
jgi:hypothetical protein